MFTYLKRHPYSRLTSIVGVLLLIIFSFEFAFAQSDVPPEEMRTVFMIGDIDTGILGIYPLLVYIVDGDELILAEEWYAFERGIGPVGLAVDEENERLFVSYESDDTIDVYNARNMNPIDQIQLAGTSNLAGIEVHQSSNRLLVVDRYMPTLFEFSLSTYQMLDSWTLSNCAGAVGIDTAGDTLYVTCSDATTFSNVVHYYDLNSQAEIGTITLTREAVAIAATDYPETTIYTSGWSLHDYLSQYYLSSGIETTADLDDGGKGLTLNPATGLVYAVKGFGGPFTMPVEWGAIRVYDMATMNQLNEYFYAAGFNKPSPTDAVASTIPFGGTVKKECISHPTGIIQEGDTVVFRITIENRHTARIHVLPMVDDYDVNHLVYVSSNPASDNNINDGMIDWSDLISSIGHDLWPGNSESIDVTFTANPDPCDDIVEGVNLAQMVGAEDIGGTMLTDAAGIAEYTIECGCQTNDDCNDDLFCNGLEYCDAGGSCQSAATVPCQDDSLYCNGAETCNEATDQCEHSGDPCSDDGLYCNGNEACNERDDVCDHSGDPCSDDGLWCNGSESCNESTNQCDHVGAPDCSDDGLYCNGAESCNEANDQCDHSGDPCTNDGIFCNGAETCNESADSCDHSGDPCVDDGLYCNGTESCNEANDQCDHTNAPCPDDGTFCNGDESCDEATDSCSSTGDPCIDDGLFCNGTESCNDDTDTCDHSGDPCVDDGLYCNGTESCNDDTDACDHSGDPCIDDGLFCNGTESCNDDTDTCDHSGDPCEEDEECNEVTDSCETEETPPPDSSDDDSPDPGDGDDEIWPEGSVSGGCCGC